MAKFWLALTLVLVFLGSLAPTGTGDSFMHLALGRLLAAEGTFPKLDIFLFTIPDYEWQLWHEWLAYLYYYAQHSTIGFGGIIVVRALWLTLFAGILWRFGRVRGVPHAVLAAALLCIYIVAFERCRLDRACFFGDLFIAGLVMVLLEVDRMGRAGKWLWLLPLWFMLWMNWHGSFPLGWFFLGSYIALRFKGWAPPERKRWVTVLLLSVLATLINPIGFQAWLHPLNIFNDLGSFQTVNSEWQPFYSPIFDAGIRWRIGVFLAIGFCFAAMGLKRRAWFEILAAVVLIYSCFRSVRFAGIAAFGLGAIALHEMRFWRWPRWSAVAGGAVAAVAAAAVLFLLPGYAFYWPREIAQGRLFLSTSPVAAARFLTTVPPGNVFNEYDMGGVLAWELNGRMKIAAHGNIHRANLVHEYYWRYQKSPEDFRQIMVNGKVEYFAALQSELAATPGSGWVQELRKNWLVIYSDEVAVVFKRVLDYSKLRAP